MACSGVPSPDPSTPSASPVGPSPTPAEPPLDTIAYLFDGRPEDADLVNGPALAGLELAASQAGGFEIEPANVTEDPEEALRVLAELGEDPAVAAAVVAPWTAPVPGAVGTLADAGVPVVSLSWAWEASPERPRLTLSLASSLRAEARMLLAAPHGSPRCLGSDADPMSRAVADAVETVRRGPDLRSVGNVDLTRPTSTEAVVRRIEDEACATLLWTGGPESLDFLLEALPQPPEIVGTSRIKTSAGLLLAEDGPTVRAVCACVDVTLARGPKLRRFVHDFQADSASAPGVFGVEGYDVGRTLIEQIAAGGGDRGELAARLAALDGFPGLTGGYVRRPGGEPVFTGAPPGIWRAEGSRWLPERLKI